MSIKIKFSEETQRFIATMPTAREKMELLKRISDVTLQYENELTAKNTLGSNE